MGPRQAPRQCVPAEPGKRGGIVTCPLLPAHYLAKVVQAQQPVDALWSTVVFDARFNETLSPNLQSGFLTNFTNCRGFGGLTVGDKPTG